MFQFVHQQYHMSIREIVIFRPENKEIVQHTLTKCLIMYPNSDTRESIWVYVFKRRVFSTA